MTQLNIEQSEGANEKEESPAELDEKKKQVNPQLKNISVSLHLHNIVINESNRKEEEKELRSLKRRWKKDQNRAKSPWKLPLGARTNPWLS